MLLTMDPELGSWMAMDPLIPLNPNFSSSMLTMLDLTNGEVSGASNYPIHGATVSCFPQTVI